MVKKIKKSDQTKTLKKSTQDKLPKKKKNISKQKQKGVEQSNKKVSRQVKTQKVKKVDEKKIQSTVQKKQPKERKRLAIISKIPVIGNHVPKQYVLIKDELQYCQGLVNNILINTKEGYYIIKEPIKGQWKAEDVEKEIKQRFIKQNNTKKKNQYTLGMIDVVFCVSSFTVSATIQKFLKNKIYEIMQHLTEEYQDQPISIRFGFITYRDHWYLTQTFVTCSYDLDLQANIKKFIKQIKVLNGGLAILDGLYMAAKYISWRDNTQIPSLRYIYHLLNYAPNRKLQGLNDKKPCKCGLNVDYVADVINERKIHYRLIDCQFNQKDSLQDLKTILKSKLNDYEECKSYDFQMDLRIDDMGLGDQIPSLSSPYEL